jgi:light-regulated signal transduction histidine kinase (bacteriophytochrome)
MRQLSQYERMVGQCEREPIHVPGAIQPGGAIVVADGENVVAFSENTPDYLGPEASVTLGGRIASDHPLAALLTSADYRASDSPAQLDTPSGRCIASAHRNAQGLLIIEILSGDSAGEAASEATIAAVRDRTLDEITAAECPASIMAAAAAGIRRISGFDRVLVYRLDRDANGEVMAEDRASTEPSFLGHHFPASDIPPQARALYEQKLLRVIEDAGYSPVPLRCADGIAPIDLGMADLRAVSPVHIEYMRNMGTAASMVISLLSRDGSLWGLIACHHPVPMRVPLAVRRAAAGIGRIMNRVLVDQERSESSDRLIEAERRQRSLLIRMAEEEGLEGSLRRHAHEVLQLVNAGGAAVIIRGEPILLGSTPLADRVTELAQRLFDETNEPVFASECLSEFWPDAAADRATASGLLAVSLASERADALMWFRPEVVRRRVWAGEPRKLGRIDASGALRIGPRQSFAAWEELVEYRSLAWLDWELEVAESLRSALVNIVLRIDSLSREITERIRAEWRASEAAEALRRANRRPTDPRDPPGPRGGR